MLTWIDDRNGNSDVYACIIDPDVNPNNPVASILDRLTTSDLDMPKKVEICQTKLSQSVQFRNDD